MGTHRRSSSVVDHLYPGDVEHVDTPAISSRELPLKVGVAFVPEAEVKRNEGAVFSVKQKLALARQISDDFRKCPYVRDIELIPSAYLVSKGSFVNLDGTIMR